MKQRNSKLPSGHARIKITDEMRERLVRRLDIESLPEMARRARLPYALVYNVIHRRIKSLSARDFRMLTGESPPPENTLAIDGTYFRNMVDLWLFLHEDVTKSSLFREFRGVHYSKKIDYRIFSGQTASVPPWLEKKMEDKFLACGVDPPTIRKWIEEVQGLEQGERISYTKIRPALLFLHTVLDVHPTYLLGRLFSRYETGDLKSVAAPVGRRVLALQQRAAAAKKTGRRYDLERLREEIYGRKSGYTLYARVEEELLFLKRYAGRSPKKYLGRSRSAYQRGKVKRIASWRAERIMADCSNFIRRNPGISVDALPSSQRRRHVTPLAAVLVLRAADMLSREDGLLIERQILTPLHARGEYGKAQYGFTRFERASSALGMKKKAFDLMVARNCEIFRGIGRYAHRWYLSDLYLKELAQKDSFELITAKYELMARVTRKADGIDGCLM